MVVKNVVTHSSMEVTEQTGKVVVVRSKKDFPVEVVMLLEVFARIEARRRARVRDECKEAN